MSKKNQKELKSLFEKKIKDRNRIKGLCFSYANDKPIMKFKKKEPNNAKDEYDYRKIMYNYKNLKHGIFLKEQEEKRLKKLELQTEDFKDNLHFSNLQSILNQFIRNKTNNYGLMKSKINLDNAERNIRKNRVNSVLQKVSLHFTKVRSKIDTGKLGIEEFKNEKALNKLIDIIVQSKKKHSNMKKAREKSIKINSNKLLINKKPNIFFKTNSSFLESPVEIKKMNKNTLSPSYTNCSASYASRNNETNSNSSKTKEKSKNNVLKNINSFGLTPQTTQKNNSSEKSSLIHIVINNNQSEIEDSLSRGRHTSNIPNMKHYYPNLVNTPQIKKIKKWDHPRSSIIYRYKKLKKEKRIHSGSFKYNSNKVQNKPLFTAKIEDFVNAFNKIKLLSERNKIKYKEYHLSTYENIDKFIKIKEDLLMFILKKKYFNSQIPVKGRKRPISRKIFVQNLKEKIKLFDKC